MLIQVNYGDMQRSETLEQAVVEKIRTALGQLTDRLTRVEVHLRDDSSTSKQTPMDKRCMMEARPRGMRPLAIEESGDDLYRVVTQASRKLARNVRKAFDRSNRR